MRPIHTTFLVLSLSLAGAALAQPGVDAPAADADVTADATQALPPAEVPAAALVAFEPAERREPSSDALSPDVPDRPAVAQEIQKESQELEDLRQAEEAARLPEPTGPAEHPGGAAEALGLESPLRDRVDGALGRDVAPVAGEAGRIALLPELDHDLKTLQGEYDIPIEVNASVAAYVRFFQSPMVRGHFVKWLGRSHRYLERYRQILKEEGVPADTVFLAMIESGFGNFAYSRAKASGPWQFIGPTGKLYGLQQDFWVDERRDPEKSAVAAARYLKKLYEQTGDWRLAWAGYNAGVGRIFNAQKKGYSDFWEMAATKGRRVLRAETKGYVPKLMAAAIITKHPEAFGFKADEIDPQQWEDYAEVSIPNATLLSVAARAAGVTEREVIDLNPELRRACTPPRPYQLKIPRSQADTFAANWPAMQGAVRVTFAGHVIRRGDTLSSVAARYGVPVQGILEMNGLKSVKKLKVGTELLIPKPVASGVAVARAPEPARRAEPAHRVVAAPAGVAVAAAEAQVAKAEPAVAKAEPAVAKAEPVVARADVQPAARADVQPVAQAEAPVVAKAERPARTTLRVRAGDTLWSISQRFRVELDDLCRWNGIKNPRHHKLLVGAQLVVFGGERG